MLEAAALDTELAVEVADTATVVKGYGEVRRRLSAGFERLLDEVLAPALARDREQGQGYARATARCAGGAAADARGREGNRGRALLAGGGSLIEMADNVTLTRAG